jgi:hypothetical protein
MTFIDASEDLPIPPRPIEERIKLAVHWAVGHATAARTTTIFRRISSGSSNMSGSSSSGSMAAPSRPSNTPPARAGACGQIR